MSCASTFEFWFMVAGAGMMAAAWLMNQAALRLVADAKRLLAEAEAHSLKAPS